MFFRHTDSLYYFRCGGDPRRSGPVAMNVAFLQRLAKLVEHR